MSVFHDLSGLVNEIIKSVKEKDKERVTVYTRSMQDIVKKMDPKGGYTPMQMSLVFSEIFKSHFLVAHDFELLSNIVRELKEVYGETHLVLADICEFKKQRIFCFFYMQ
jgi:hypothetical protein